MKTIFFLFTFGILLLNGCISVEQSNLQKSTRFEGEITYQTISNYFVNLDKKYINMAYDTEAAYEITNDQIIAKHHQNPQYLQAIDSAFKYKEIPEKLYPDMRKGREIPIAGYKNVYDLLTYQYTHFHNHPSQEQRIVSFRKIVPHPKYHKIQEQKRDTTIMGYACKRYTLTKLNGIVDFMWVTKEINTYIPPYYESINPAAIQDEKKASNNYIFLSIPQGLCLMVESIEPPEASITRMKSSKIIKVTHIKRR